VISFPVRRQRGVARPVQPAPQLISASGAPRGAELIEPRVRALRAPIKPAAEGLGGVHIA